MRTVRVKPCCQIPIGRLGENEATQVVFDVEHFKIYGNGTFTLLHQRPGDVAPYPVEIEHSGTQVIWNVSALDLDVAGYGRCELVYTVGETVAKSEIYATVIGDALNGGAEPPEPWEDWVTRVLMVGEKVNEWLGQTAGGEVGQVWMKTADGAAWMDEGGGKPYLSLSRVAAYLYDVSFAEIPPDNFVDFAPAGGCTSYVSGGKLYRNLDLEYGERATFRVRCSGFEGTATLHGLTDTSINSGLVGQLPFHMTDGKNDAGIMVSEHVLFNDWNWHGVHGGTPLTKLPYLILKNVRSMATLETDLSAVIPDLCTTPALDEHEYLLQYLVTDGETTKVIIPPTTGQHYQIVDATENPKLTNFRWVENETVERADLQRRPTGVERWNMIPAALKDLRFTLCYESPDRLSEFIGISGTTKDSTDEQLEAIYFTARQKYLYRTRNGETWQTMCSIIYAADGIESLCVQENWTQDYATGAGSSLPLEVVDGLLNCIFEEE